MKSKLIIGTLLLFIGGAAFAQQKFTIKGTLSKLREDVKVIILSRQWLN